MARRGWTRGLAAGALIPMGGTVRPRAEAVAHNPPASRPTWSVASVRHSRDGDNRVAGRPLVWTSPVEVEWGVAHNRRRPAHRQPHGQQRRRHGTAQMPASTPTASQSQRRWPSPPAHPPAPTPPARFQFTCRMDQPAGQPTPPPTTQYYRHLHLSMNGRTRCVCSPSVAPEQTSVVAA